MKKTILAAALLLATPVAAKIRLPKTVGDMMVLQRNAELKIWGWADKGEKVTVRFRGCHYDTEADGNGEWAVTLPEQTAGGPFKMEINETTLRDILVGDVFLLSGQSNQENPIHRLTEKFPEIEASNNHNIRHYKVPHAISTLEAKDDVEGDERWHSAVASDVLNWTSLAFFFATETYKHTGVPVGVIVSAYGGSSIQSWVDQDHLKEVPQYVYDAEAYNAASEARRDKGDGEWMKASLDDGEWTTASLPSSWASQGLKTKGSVWYRFHFTCPKSMVGRHAKIYMGRMEDEDIVYVNGKEVGHTYYFGPPRKYDIPAGTLREGDNVVTLKLVAKNGNGAVIADKPYKIVGDEDEVNLTGEWKYRVGYDLRDAEPYADRLKNLDAAGSGMYNAMIYPLRNWKFCGAVWYQGESNTDKPDEYCPMLKGLIANWRKLFDWQEMPFMLVQLPNYMEKHAEPSNSNWAKLREAQLEAHLATPYTSLATTYDVGEWNDIHPLDKKSVAQRLFSGARRLVYKENVVSEGPIYKGMEVVGNKIVVTFDTKGRGLKARGGTLRHFAIAGADKRFVWADAAIKGDKVIVSSKAVNNPVAVRYAWSDNPDDANLVNKDGLLASPFRTDDW